jgi:hypothetical protein
MTRTETDEFLATCRNAAIAVCGADGFPLAALAVRAPEQGGLVLALDSSSPVAAALRSGTAACVVADTWPRYDEIRGVIVRGQSRPTDGAAHSLALDATTVSTFDFGKAS